MAKFISAGIKDHTKLTNIGTNTHAQIDTHIAGAGADVHGDSYVLKAGASTTVVNDTFTRADSSSTLGSAETGGAWTDMSDVASTWGISNNQAYHVSGGNNHLLTVVDSGLCDCTVQVTIATQASQGSGVAFRLVDVSNYWFVYTDFPGRYILRKWVGGSPTTVQTYSGGYASGDVIQVVLSGTSITVNRNGSPILSTTDAALQYATKHGLRATYGDTTTRWDNFSVTQTVSQISAPLYSPTNRFYLSNSSTQPSYINGRLAINKYKADYELDVSGTVNGTAFTRSGTNIDSVYGDHSGMSQYYLPYKATSTLYQNSALYYNGINTGLFTTAPGIIASDTFTRADSTSTMGTTETGGFTWTAYDSTTWGISSNQAYKVSGGNNEVCVAFDAGKADGTYQATIATVGGTGTGIIFRLQDGSNYWIVYADTTYVLRPRVGGAWGSSTNIAVTPTNGDVIKVVLLGNSIKVYINGTLRANISDSTFNTATNYGLRGIYSSSAPRFDNVTFSESDVLHIAGESWITGQLSVGTTDPTAQLQVHSEAATRVATITRAAASQSANIHEWQDSSGNVLACVDESGNVGIGTDNPSTNLQIVKSQNGWTQIHVDNQNGGTVAYSEFKATTDTATMYFGAGPSTAAATGLRDAAYLIAETDAGGGLVLSARANAPIKFFTNTSTESSGEKMRITGAGDVGINETVPDYKLDVNGSFGFTPGSSVTPVDNGDVTIEFTNDTTLTFKGKGSDGTVRSATLTLA